MDEAAEKTPDFKASNVKACRICLATDVKVYDLQGTHLGTCIESIGAFTNSYEGLPNYACYECAPILLKCSKLIEKSKTAQTTLMDIFSKNGEINTSLIENHKKSENNLQSSLDSYLLLNYFYIKYDEDSNTSDFVKTESDSKENIKLKKEIKEESSEELSDSEILKMITDATKQEESDSDSDVEAIEVDVPVVEIESDDDKLGDDFISLKTYNVKMDCDQAQGLSPQDCDVPQYYRVKSGVIGIKKPKKKKKKKKTKSLLVEPLPSVFVEDSYVKKYFNIHVMPPPRNDKRYSCKSCSETFEYVNEAKDHTVIGCQIVQRSNSDGSPLPIQRKCQGPEANVATTTEARAWKVWPGATK